MYIEEKIFGPLSFKQFLCLAAGIGAMYLVRPYVAEGKLFYPVMVLIGIATLILILRFSSKKVENLKEYFEIKKSELSPEEYVKFLHRKIAEIQSQIYMRREKGLAEDPKLREGLDMLENLLKGEIREN